MKRSRLPIILVLVVSLVVGAVTRDWARALRTQRVEGQPVGEQSGSNSLANMNSFALALLLGGLRGPLVMFLWTSSESQKAEKNIEGFDTQVEWIRLLQPEFDTVHIFQVWNKAYNISVQMASLANKYATILDAIDYAKSVEASRPNNINMIYEIGKIYFDKLGDSAERAYYRKRVREESLPHPARQKLSRNDPAWRRLELDPVLDKQGNILPQYLKPRYARPADLPKDSEWNDGSELQYLKPYEPFPYGVSTFVFAYNYYKRAQVMQSVLKQRHAQLSDLVVDSRPALALKNWSEDEAQRGRQCELRAFNQPVPEERRDMDLPTADIAPSAPVSDRALVEEAINAYEVGARVAQDAITDYERHLRNFQVNLVTYQSHMDELRASTALLKGDADYLKAILASGAERAKLLAAAGKEYEQALRKTQLAMLKYYIDDELAQAAFPQGIRRTNLEQLPTSLYDATIARVLALSKQRGYDPQAEDRLPLERQAARCQARMERIAAAK